MGTSFISGQADVALVELCRGARLAENTLDTVTARNCTTEVMRLAWRVRKILGADDLLSREDMSEVTHLISLLREVGHDEWETVMVDDECCMTAPEDLVVRTHRGIQLDGAVAALQAFLDLHGLWADRLRATQLLGQL